jgi:hypothetical protein
MRKPTYVIDATAICLGNHINFASRVAAHIQSTLGIPSKTHGTEAISRTLGEVGVGHNVDSCSGAVGCSFR